MNGFERDHHLSGKKPIMAPHRPVAAKKLLNELWHRDANPSNVVKQVRALRVAMGYEHERGPTSEPSSKRVTPSSTEAIADRQFDIEFLDSPVEAFSFTFG